MFNEDQPIKTKDYDELKRINFAENLSNNIEYYFNSNFPVNSLTIGLIGEWGSGKTSLLNLTEECLKSKNIKIINFNPWIYSSYNQLIEQFFDEIIGQFNDDGELITDLRKYLFKFNKRDLLKSITQKGISIVNKEAGEIVAEFVNYDSEEENLKKIKDKINKELEKYKIVCIIDDLDRLASDEIVEIFKLVKIMADFNNIIYILAFDESIVAEALTPKHIDGEKYVEKIVNIPIKVPLVTQFELKEILTNYLTIFSENNNIKLDKMRLEYLLDYAEYKTKINRGILQFFKNIRDIKRFKNMLEFNIAMVEEDVNFVDFIVITAIQLFKPKLYDNIKYNGTLLVEYPILKNYYSDFPEIFEKEQEMFEEIVNDDDNVRYILQSLFPKMSFIYHTNKISDYSEKYEKDQRICHKDHFKTYFKLNIDLKEITEHELTITIEFINAEKDDEVITQINYYLKEDKLNLFFDRIKNRVEKIDKPKFFLEIIFSLDVSITLNSTVWILCLELIRKINLEHRFNTLKKNFEENSNIIFLFEIVEFIKNNNFIPYEYGEEILSKSEIEALTNIVKNKFRNLISTDMDYINENFARILELGKELGLDDVNEEIISEKISTSKGLIEFLEVFIHEDIQHVETSISNIGYFTDINKIKEKIYENYGDIKDNPIVVKFLEGVNNQ